MDVRLEQCVASGRARAHLVAVHALGEEEDDAEWWLCGYVAWAHLQVPPHRSPPRDEPHGGPSVNASTEPRAKRPARHRPAEKEFVCAL
ncbi:unnamed protein product [Lampetra fluviatilis]